MPELTVIPGLFGLGIVVGAISPTFGIGGGLLTVPALLLIYGQAFGFTGDTATATSLGVIVFTSLSGTIAYMREKRIDYKVALLFMLFAIPGSVGGGLISRWMGAKEFAVDPFQYTFAGVMIATALYKLFTILADRFRKGDKDRRTLDEPAVQKAGLARRLVDRHGTVFEYTVRLFPGTLIAFIGGFLGAMLGLGGGVIYVAILTMALGVPAVIATATSTFTILAANPFAVALRLRSIQWGWVVALAAGTVLSASIVPRFLHRVRSEWILAGFWTLAILASVRLLLKVSGVVI
ncbi:MAG: sulfite exporter TauE/SafE family protein [Spirochaetes bacterium]|nr:sulfite exporter TauE/SafE family protein [Spirochaetota bacterium]